MATQSLTAIKMLIEFEVERRDEMPILTTEEMYNWGSPILGRGAPIAVKAYQFSSMGGLK